MTSLNSSSEHKQQGLLSPNQRWQFLRKIRCYMSDDNAAVPAEVDAMQDLCYHLYTESVAERMAKHLDVSVSELRKAFDIGLEAVKDVKEAQR